ncbi:ABC transporter substrate-binding protein [Reinekea marinisedimentorum]|uniref:Alpha-glucoside transport system substrate-binding protein n=1 Tax=Reinekea marinisedimentorum TaxID=230495 RepID=A0A4R3HT06_9GAMM|nr:ABC transporter substrate-binding protein [Reinekea marinisedimentorum]TCS36162.1 alpha-glucoside transport system substrate-binding protein [Reinekea marinisedimentorum]
MTTKFKKLSIAVALSTALTGTAFSDGHMVAKGTGGYSWDSLDKFENMDLSGVTVTVTGPWLAPENGIFTSIMSYFEEATGADVQYTGSDSFEQQIVIDTQAKTPPNVAIFPQPGLAADLASRGLLSPVSSNVKNAVLNNYAAAQSWVDLATYKDNKGKDQFYGVFFRVDLKSLVWYSPDNFDDYGYDVPETMEDLLALSDQMVKDGNTPWCIGLGSGAATGWPATDWVEDIMLRTQTPEDYDKWVTNELKFDDPKVVEAIETFGKFARNDDYVQGGATAVGTTDFRDSPKDLFTVPAKCFMHRQASFIPAFFPEDIVVGEDADFFYFPAFESKDLGKPVLGAGTVVTVTKANKGTEALLEYLTTPLAHELWMAKGGFLSPQKDAKVELYKDETLQRQGEILLNATTFRFDGSDLMPGAIGAGSFWTGMVDYVDGKSADAVAKDIQKSWDAIK